MALEGKKTDYILESDNEMSRLSNQHEVIKDAMGGLLQMPIDYSKGPLRILDSGTADGGFEMLYLRIGFHLVFEHSNCTHFADGVSNRFLDSRSRIFHPGWRSRVYWHRC